MVTSDSSLLYRLQQDMAFNVTNFDEINNFGEIPPGEMFKLLTTEWHLKENVALAFVDAYGGHILNSATALEKLDRLPDLFDVGAGYRTAEGSVRPCILWAKKNNQLPLMRAALQSLAKDGYIEVADVDNDRIAESICRSNVGSLVRRHSFAAGFNDELWASKIKSDWICVSSSQSMRLFIADTLKRMKKDA